MKNPGKVLPQVRIVKFFQFFFFNFFLLTTAVLYSCWWLFGDRGDTFPWAQSADGVPQESRRSTERWISKCRNQISSGFVFGQLTLKLGDID